MDTVPPSYAVATTRDPWQYIANYLPTASLYNLNLVSSEIYRTTRSLLWGNPSVHFAGKFSDLDPSDPDYEGRVYYAFTRFLRTLKRARLSVRYLTHTLRIPSVNAEVFEGPSVVWLRDILKWLPALQSVTLSGVTWLDHAALLTLNRLDDQEDQIQTSAFVSQSLKLLIVRDCPNATSRGISELLSRLHRLRYLDLSGTSAAKDQGVLKAINGLSELRILKLRGVQLRDEDLSILLNGAENRLQVLDIGGNLITDRGADTIAATCRSLNGSTSPIVCSFGPDQHEEFAAWPRRSRHTGYLLTEIYKDETYDSSVNQLLKKDFVPIFPFDNVQPVGLHHLKLSENYLTHDGLKDLLPALKLYVLDVGSMKPMQRQLAMRDRGTRDRGPHQDTASVAAEHLIMTFESISLPITYLRIDHSLVTKAASSKYEIELPSTSTSCVSEQVRGSQDPHESIATIVDESPPLYEPSPQCEALESDSQLHEPHLELHDAEMRPPRSVHGQERLSGEANPRDPIEINKAPIFETHSTTQGGLSRSFQRSAEDWRYSFSRGFDEGSRPDVTRQRRAYLRSREQHRTRGLLPGKLPNLRTLVLTDVPYASHSRELVQSLIDFITYCAEEAKLDRTESSLLTRSVYRAGNLQRAPNYNAAGGVFSLRRLILEMSHGKTSRTLSKDAEGGQPNASSKSKWSATEDEDSEVLWSAAAEDFSFFEDEKVYDRLAGDRSKEIRGSPPLETTIHSPHRDFTTGPNATSLDHGNSSLVDTIEELSRFRRERQEAYDEAEESNREEVIGHWHGEIRIVRAPRS